MKKFVLLFAIVYCLACSKENPIDPIDPEPGNRAPIANAGGDQKVVIGSLVKVNASSSSDPDGDELSYSWQIVGRPEGSNAALIGAGQLEAEFTLDKAGVYELELRVSDQENEARDTILISNSTPIINGINPAFSFRVDKDPDNAIEKGRVVYISGQFFSPNIMENMVIVADVEYEIEYMENMIMSVRVPQEAISGELKITVGEESIVWGEPLLVVQNEPIQTFIESDSQLQSENITLASGMYQEIGTVFKPNKNGKIVAIASKRASNASSQIRLTLWDVEEKTVLASIDDYEGSSSSTLFFDKLEIPITVEAGKEYAITGYSSHWSRYARPGFPTIFPHTIGDVELVRTIFGELSDNPNASLEFPESNETDQAIFYGHDLIFAADPE